MNHVQACRWTRELSSDLFIVDKSLPRPKVNEQVIKWNPPPPGFLKINVDAAFKEKNQQGATGVIVRDEYGHVVAAKCKWYDSIPNVLTAEAYATRDGTVLMNLLKHQKVIVETDNLELLALWRSKTTNRSYILACSC